jgi:hypothetical protein
MSQGTMLETQETPEPKELDAQGHPIVKDEEADEPITTTKTPDGKDVVDVASVIHWRKQAKAARKEVATLKQQVDQLEPHRQRLEAAAPILEKLQALPPEQQAAFLEAVRTNTAPSRTQTQDPDDVEARELAEDLGLVDASGVLDVARGRRMLERLDKRAEAKARTIVAPYAQTTAQGVAYTLRERTKQQADPNTGTPYATAESIDEAFAMLKDAPELAANPAVSAIILGTAMLIDKSRGRVPKAPERYEYSEPLLTEPAGGRRGAPVITDETKRLLDRVGLTEKEFTNVQVPAHGMGRGVVLE